MLLLEQHKLRNFILNEEKSLNYVTEMELWFSVPLAINNIDRFGWRKYSNSKGGI